MLGIGFLLLVSLVLNAWIAAMGIAVPRAASFIMSYLVVAVLFAGLYKVVPDVKLKWSDVALGAMITSVLFMAGKQFIGAVFRAAPAFGRRIALPARRSWCCCGSTTRRSYSFGAPSSVRCIRGPWDPIAEQQVHGFAVTFDDGEGFCTSGRLHVRFPDLRRSELFACRSGQRRQRRGRPRRTVCRGPW